jgi:REP element-mobilizing transposase RayT
MSFWAQNFSGHFPPLLIPSYTTPFDESEEFLSMRQMSFFKRQRSDHGGNSFTTRKARARCRPLSTSSTMHLVLRSELARGDWSFRKPKHELKIKELVKKFSQRFGVRVLSMANVGNHLHFQIKLSNRYTYKPFIRALSSSIAMAVTGASRWKKIKELEEKSFWDKRPFTRIIEGFRGFLTLKNYIEVNQLEGLGLSRGEARWVIAEGLDTC